jgi:hypothetical protein
LGTNDYVIVGSRLRRCYFLLSGAYLLAAYFVVRGFLPRRLLTYEPVWHALEYIRRRAEPSKVIATSVPHLAYLRTGHRAVLPPLEPDPETAARYLDAVPVSFLVLDELGLPGISERYAAPVVARHPASWRLVYTAPDNKARVYERVR